MPYQDSIVDTTVTRWYMLISTCLYHAQAVPYRLMEVA